MPKKMKPVIGWAALHIDGVSMVKTMDNRFMIYDSKKKAHHWKTLNSRNLSSYFDIIPVRITPITKKLCQHNKKK